MARKIILASGKGGVGKSSLTAGLSVALADAGKKVLAVDMDIGLRSLDLILGLNEKQIFNWGDIILGYCDFEDALISSEPVSLLGAPPEFNESFTVENLKNVIDIADEKFDFILLDAPAGIGEGLMLAAGVADDGIVVVTSDEVSVRSGEIASRKLYDSGIENVSVIINRFKESYSAKGRYLNIDDVIDSSKLRLLGIVPEDPQITFCAMKGKPVEKSTPSYRAFKRIQKRLFGENIPLFKKV